MKQGSLLRDVFTNPLGYQAKIKQIDCKMSCASPNLPIWPDVANDWICKKVIRPNLLPRSLGDEAKFGWLRPQEIWVRDYAIRSIPTSPSTAPKSPNRRDRREKERRRRVLDLILAILKMAFYCGDVFFTEIKLKFLFIDKWYLRCTWHCFNWILFFFGNTSVLHANLKS